MWKRGNTSTTDDQLAVRRPRLLLGRNRSEALRRAVKSGAINSFESWQLTDLVFADDDVQCVLRGGRDPLDGEFSPRLGRGPDFASVIVLTKTKLLIRSVGVLDTLSPKWTVAVLQSITAVGLGSEHSRLVLEVDGLTVNLGVDPLERERLFRRILASAPRASEMPTTPAGVPIEKRLAASRLLVIFGLMITGISCWNLDNPGRLNEEGGAGAALSVIFVYLLYVAIFARGSKIDWRTVAPLVLLCTLVPFAAEYRLLSLQGAFHGPLGNGQHLSATDAAYFTAVTFSTVGYGDFYPISEVARRMVSIQLVLDPILLVAFVSAFVKDTQYKFSHPTPKSRAYWKSHP